MNINGSSSSYPMEQFYQRMAELSEILRKEKPNEFWPDWVWKCVDGILDNMFPENYPRLSDPNGMSFLTGFVIGSVPKIAEILSSPTSVQAEAGIKTGFAVIPEENQKEVLGLFQSSDLKKEIMRFVPPEEMFSDFWSSPKISRVAFAKGLLAATSAEEDLIPSIERASGMTFNLSLTLWLQWPNIAQFSNIAQVYRGLEAAFGEAGRAIPTRDAFKQYAHRIGLSQFLRKQKRADK